MKQIQRVFQYAIPGSAVPMPPFARRGLLFVLMIVVTFALAPIAVWLSWIDLTRFPIRYFWLFGMLPAFGPLIGAGFIIGRRWRIQRGLVRAGGRLCTTCGYDLSGLPEAGPCPECASPYVHADTIKAWAAAGFLATGRKEPITIRRLAAGLVRRPFIPLFVTACLLGAVALQISACHDLRQADALGREIQRLKLEGAKAAQPSVVTP